jgi:hypothetical protein
MKTHLVMLILLASSHFAGAAAIDRISTDKLKTNCDIWIAAQNPDNRETDETVRYKKTISAIMCAGYINGLSNEMIGELSWLDDTHKRVVIGNWQDGVTVKQEILIFVDYVNQNPATLNKPAVTVLRKSVEAAGIYTYESAP